MVMNLYIFYKKMWKYLYTHYWISISEILIKEMTDLERKLNSYIEEEEKQLIRKRLIELYNLIYNI